MTSAFHESFDSEWPQAPLFRDLMIADSEKLAQFIRYHRPLHVALTAIDPTLRGETDAEDLRKLLRWIGMEPRANRYARIILASESRTCTWEAVIALIANSFVGLLNERRVFCSWARPSDEGVDRMYRAIGAAQAVCLQNGVWLAPALL